MAPRIRPTSSGSRCQGVLDRGPEVRVVGREPGRDGALADVMEGRGARLGEADDKARCRRRASSASGGVELLGRELADRLEHPVALAREAEQALVDERLERVEVGVARLPRRPRACSRLRRPRAGGRAPLAVGEQVVATTRSSPAASAGADRRRGRPGAGRAAAPSRSRICAGESAVVRAAASSTASGSESSRRHSSAISSVGSSCARSQKSATASASASGGTANSTSPCDAQELAARDEQGQVRAGDDERGSSGAASTTCSKLSTRSRSRARRCARRGRSGRRAARAIVSLTSAGSRSEARSTQKTPALKSGTRVAAASIARRVFPEPPGPVSVRSRAPPAIRASTACELALPADEGARRPGEVRVRERPERREGAVAELEERDRAAMSFSRCSPSSRSGSAARAAVAAERRTCPPCAGIGNARGDVDVLADVALGGHKRRPECSPTRTRIGPDASAIGDRGRRGERGRRSREREEERVSLRIDLDAASSRWRPADDASVLGECLGVRSAPSS